MANLSLLNSSVERLLFVSLQANQQIAITLRNKRSERIASRDRQANLEDKKARGRLSKIDKPTSLAAIPESTIAGALSLVRNLNAVGKDFLKRDRAGGWGTLPRPTKFGRFAQSSIHQIGGAWQLENFLPGHCLFITGTLPGGTEAAKSAIASWSGYIVNRLMQYVRRQGLDQWMYCWEFQERGALHLHLVLYVPSFKLRNWWISNFKRLWYELMLDVSDKSGIDLFERNDRGFLKIKSWRNHPEKIRASAEICRKNIAGYLAKYMSKASQGDKKAFTYKDGKRLLRKGFYSPSRWWGSSYGAKALLRKYQNMWMVPLNGSDFVTESFFDFVDFFGLLKSKGTNYSTPDNNSYTEIIYYSCEGFSNPQEAFNTIKALIEGMVNSYSFPRCDIGATTAIRQGYQARKDDWEATLDEFIYNRDNWYRHPKLSHGKSGA